MGFGRDRLDPKSQLGSGQCETTGAPLYLRKQASVYLRQEFTIEQTDKITEMGLWIDYRDSFIAYVNGKEVARVGVGRRAGRHAQKIKVREDSGYVYVSLKDLSSVRDGLNVLAIEAHTAPENTLDFHINPSLVLED